jgi:hypothetical protein
MTTENIDDVELPQHLLDLLPTLPVTMDRKGGARLISDHLFYISPQTLKAWPIGWSAPNGRAVARTERYLKFAYRKVLQAGPTTNRWRRATAQAADAAV